MDKRGKIIKDEPCPECRKRGRDSTGNHLMVFDSGNKYCNRCNYKEINSHNYKEETQEERMQREAEATLEAQSKRITDEQKIAVKELTTPNKTYRGIRKDTAAPFGVRYSVDEESGEVLKSYYPVTMDGELCGYKIRQHPKTFCAPVGYVGKRADLFGQFKFKSNSRTVILCSGEVDALSTYQMLRDYQVRSGKGEYEPTAVVSSTVGESGAVEQCRLQYNFFAQFKKIIICPDNDEAGRKATEKLIKVLPRGKVHVMSLEHKDPNEYLKRGEDAKFIDAFFRAKQHVPAGIVSSTELYERMMESACAPKISLPPFLKKLEDMMAGGLSPKQIINIGAGTGAAKTTVINECIYYWIFNSPYKVGIVTCELDAAQYAEALMSRHLQRKLALIKSPEEKQRYLESDEVKKSAHELFVDEEGQERFSLVDDRSGTVEQVKQVIEDMIVSCGCVLIVLDPLQDLIGNLSNEEQGDFMQWQKNCLKAYNCTFLNINHVRKTQASDDQELRMPTENDFHGSSTIMKSGSANILMARNKHAEDPVERNTTYFMCSKLRWTGLTGPCGKVYYENDTHTMYDYDEYFGIKGSGEF